MYPSSFQIGKPIKLAVTKNFPPLIENFPKKYGPRPNIPMNDIPLP